MENGLTYPEWCVRDKREQRSMRARWRAKNILDIAMWVVLAFLVVISVPMLYWVTAAQGQPALGWSL